MWPLKADRERRVRGLLVSCAALGVFGCAETALSPDAMNFVPDAAMSAAADAMSAPDAVSAPDALSAPDAATFADAASDPDAASSPDAAEARLYELPVDLSAPWSATGTTVPERAVLLAGCRVDVVAQDIAAAITEAAARAGTGFCAVVIPAGTFTLTNTLDLRTGVVLLGQGSDQTHLEFALGARVTPLIRAQGGGLDLSFRGDSLGGALGDTRFAITATMAAAIAALNGPLYAEISQENDPAKFPARWEQAYAAQGVGQLSGIRSIGPNYLEMGPLSDHYLPGTGFTKYLLIRTAARMIERAGVMDLSIRRNEEAHDQSIFFDLSAGCFVKSVESIDTGWAHVAVDRSLHCSVSESWFHGAHGHGDGGRAYGVNLRSHTTGCRVEDNILQDLRHALIIQLGVSQNVYGYNFSEDSHDDIGVTKPDISGHGHQAMLNLFEGNDVEYAHVSDWHGPTPRQVLFKNRIRVLGLHVDDASERIALIDNIAESVLGVRNALRADPSVSRVICVGNKAPDLTPLVASGRNDCDNTRVYDPRPPSFYRATPLVDTATGEVLARIRQRAGHEVTQP